MREVIMAGDYWCIPPKGGSRSGRPSTKWLIETANQAWIKYRLHDPETLIKCLQDKRKRKKKKATPEQIKKDKKRKKMKARDHLRDMLEGKTDMTSDEIKETIQKTFYKWEIRACRSVQQDINENTMLITRLNKYHEHDEAEAEDICQEKRDKKDK